MILMGNREDLNEMNYGRAKRADAGMRGPMPGSSGAASSCIAYFGPRRHGPELAIEDSALQCCPDLLCKPASAYWAGSYVPLGAGIPDIVLASYEDEVFALQQADPIAALILGYLRTVNRVCVKTLCQRIPKAERAVLKSLYRLIDEQVVLQHGSLLKIAPAWKHILPEIIAIEAKVKDWKTVVIQASRNRIFAHRSYVAMPESIAQGLLDEPLLVKLGLGIISVGDEGTAQIKRQGRLQRPSVWPYYYELARIIANKPGGTNRATI